MDQYIKDNKNNHYISSITLKINKKSDIPDDPLYL